MSAKINRLQELLRSEAEELNQRLGGGLKELATTLEQISSDELPVAIDNNLTFESAEAVAKHILAKDIQIRGGDNPKSRTHQLATAMSVGNMSESALIVNFPMGIGEDDFLATLLASRIMTLRHGEK